MKPVTWGILGVSTHYRLRVHAPLSRSAELTVRAIASRSAERAREAAASFAIPRAYGSYEELLADREVEAVYIPLPNHLHAAWVKKAADAGKHVLCEKPFALNAEEAAEAVDHARRRGVLLMEAFMYRLHPQWQRAREILRTGELGAVHAVHTIFTYANLDPANIRNIAEAGGGALYDIGCYAVSASRFLLDREPLRVAALVRRDPRFSTDALASAILDFGGARALFTVGTQTFPFQRVQVFGSSGALTVTLPFNAYPDVPEELVVQTSIGTRTIALAVADQYGLLFEAFSRAVRAGGPVPTDPADAVANMKVLDAVTRSERSGGWERVG
jgi:predicted dehydrogenase